MSVSFEVKSYFSSLVRLNNNLIRYVKYQYFPDKAIELLMKNINLMREQINKLYSLLPPAVASYLSIIKANMDYLEYYIRSYYSLYNVAPKDEILKIANDNAKILNEIQKRLRRG